MKFTEKEVDRFWSKVDRSDGPDGCHLWTAGLFNSGYGQFWYRTSSVGAHRVAHILSGGDFERGPFVLHGLCGNKACCNPEHLRSGTAAENTGDMRRDGTALMYEKHGMARLTWSDVREIRKRREGGTLLRVLAGRFGVTESNICSITKGRTWREPSERTT